MLVGRRIVTVRHRPSHDTCIFLEVIADNLGVICQRKPEKEVATGPVEPGVRSWIRRKRRREDVPGRWISLGKGPARGKLRFCSEGT